MTENTAPRARPVETRIVEDTHVLEVVITLMRLEEYLDGVSRQLSLSGFNIELKAHVQSAKSA